jgi:hypothetical protein
MMLGFITKIVLVEIYNPADRDDCSLVEMSGKFVN